MMTVNVIRSLCTRCLVYYTFHLILLLATLVSCREMSGVSIVDCVNILRKFSKMVQRAYVLLVLLLILNFVPGKKTNSLSSVCHSTVEDCAKVHMNYIITIFYPSEDRTNTIRFNPIALFIATVGLLNWRQLLDYNLQKWCSCQCTF